MMQAVALIVLACLSSQTGYAYDGRGNLVTTYQYDASGNVRFVTDPRGNTVETQYDAQGRPAKVIYPATDEHPSTQTETQYDLLGRRVATVDFSFVRRAVAPCYGYNGHVSIDPEVILKLMFLLFFDNVRSERELLRMLPERLDYLWFLGFGLDDEIPDHSVLSRARARWGQAVFESLFVRTVQQCVEAGLVDGAKLHLDGSLINAHASRDSVVRSAPELIAALKRAYQVEARKLEGNLGDPHYQPVNATLVSPTDPDAPCVRQNKQGAQGDTRPRYKHHRAVDDRCGGVTAVVTTPGDVPEPTQAVTLVEQPQQNTGQTAATAVADRQYGSAENYRQLQTRGLATHIAPFRPARHEADGIFPAERFAYDAQRDTHTCPSGQTLYRQHWHERRQATEYRTRKGVCRRCPLRSPCTRSTHGRTLHRHDQHELIERAKAQGRSAAAKRDRVRRRYLMEGSFAQAANRHGFKRARWRRLWRQQIQDWLIAACQNVKLLVRALRPGPQAGALFRGAAVAVTADAHGRSSTRFLALPASFLATTGRLRITLQPAGITPFGQHALKT